MASDLDKKIVSQIEYYFGDINLPRDKFLQQKVKEDAGWVALDVLLTFKRLANLTTDQSVIATAIEKAESTLVEVSEDKKKVRRCPGQPLPEDNDSRKKELISRSAYAKGFPAEATLDEIVTFLEPHGIVDSCQRRTYIDKIDKKHIFKGSCFIIFKNVEDCKKFIEAESIKYNDTELIRKWRADYEQEKKQEIEERRGKKKNKQKDQTDEKPVKVEEITIDLPAGSIIHFTGIKFDHPITREDIREKVEEKLPGKLSFIDYSKGLPEGYLRFPAENAVEFIKLLDDGKVTIGENELVMKVVEGDELVEYAKKVANDKKLIKLKSKAKQQGKKRKGNFRQNGPAYKNRR